MSTIDISISVTVGKGSAYMHTTIPEGYHLDDLVDELPLKLLLTEATTKDEKKRTKEEAKEE